MGHVHLGVLPSTKRWREVVHLLNERAPPDEIAAAAAVAAERDLHGGAGDPIFVEAVRLLGALPLAAEGSSFAQGLNDRGLILRDRPELFDLVAALGARLDAVARRASGATDFGELSRRALLSTVTRELGDALPGLIEATPEDLQAATRRLGQPRAFAAFARSFFTTLLRQTLSSWLDRTLSAHVGPDMPFRNAAQRAAFDQALEQYCFEATRIMREFAVGYYAKARYVTGRFDIDEAAAFGSVAFRKIGEELRRKRGASV